MTISRSVFVARTREVTEDSAIRAFLTFAKTADPRADHYCYAYRLGEGHAEIIYQSDGGEPGGTAGRPILHALLAAGVTNAMIVVARYFGGKKLGIPGLIDAYGAAAREVLSRAGTIARKPARLFELSLGYAHLDQVRWLLHRHGVEEIDVSYGSVVTVLLRVLLEECAGLISGLSALGLTVHEVDAAPPPPLTKGVR